MFDLSVDFEENEAFARDTESQSQAVQILVVQIVEPLIRGECRPRFVPGLLQDKIEMSLIESSDKREVRSLAENFLANKRLLLKTDGVGEKPIELFVRESTYSIAANTKLISEITEVELVSALIRRGKGKIVGVTGPNTGFSGCQTKQINQ